MLLSFDSYTLLIFAVPLTCAYCVLLGVYRLYLSPLAGFPGPKLAALTSWYEFYYDYFKRGRFTWVLKDLHKQYGQLT